MDCFADDDDDPNEYKQQPTTLNCEHHLGNRPFLISVDKLPFTFPPPSFPLKRGPITPL
jgi:hypothetical protein